MPKRSTSSADHVSETLDRIVAAFERGDVPTAIQKAVYPPADIPCAAWSLNNRVLLMLSGTADARGYRQWQQVGRNVMKGAKAVRILVPRMVTKTEKDAAGKESKRSFLAGFMARPVFAVESTEGEPVDYKIPPVPTHPLMDVAAQWGIKIGTAGFNGAAYGWTDFKASITLCTPDELTWFHELGHVSDGREHDLKGGQHSDQEIVAQLVAAVLARLVGRKDPNEGYSFKYVQGYASAWFPKASPADALRKACHRVMSRTCKALEKILSAANGQEEIAPVETAAA